MPVPWPEIGRRYHPCRPLGQPDSSVGHQIRAEQLPAGCLIRRLRAGEGVGLPSGPTRRQQAELWNRTVGKVCRRHTVTQPTKVIRRHGADQTQPPAAAVKPPASGLWERPDLSVRLAGKTGRRTGPGKLNEGFWSVNSAKSLDN